MAERKPGKRAIFERLAIRDTILEMIPSDGSCIRYKKLNELRIQKHIGLGTMNETLKEFEGKGIIRKEPLKLSHGAGTCYRRTIPIPKLDELGWSAFIRENKKRIELIENLDEKEETEALFLTRALENYISVIFKTLKAAKKMNRIAAGGFIDAAGKTYIASLLKDINSLQTEESQALKIAEKAFGHPQFKLDKARIEVKERENREKGKEDSSNLSESDYGFSECLFNWDGIPGNDNGKLIEILKEDLDIDWVENAKIEKIDDNTIRVYTEENSLSLKLNNEKTKVNLEIDDDRCYQFSVLNEKEKLNVYYRITPPDGG